jgi:antitoxin component of MazEF toxin-antitoxin module
MKAIRHLARHGGATHVCIPPQMIDFLRWHVGDALVVELRDRTEIVIHLPGLEDLRAEIPARIINATLPELGK